MVNAFDFNIWLSYQQILQRLFFTTIERHCFSHSFQLTVFHPHAKELDFALNARQWFFSTHHGNKLLFTPLHTRPLESLFSLYAGTTFHTNCKELLFTLIEGSLISHQYKEVFFTLIWGNWFSHSMQITDFHTHCRELIFTHTARNCFSHSLQRINFHICYRNWFWLITSTLNDFLHSLQGTVFFSHSL